MGELISVSGPRLWLIATLSWLDVLVEPLMWMESGVLHTLSLSMHSRASYLTGLRFRGPLRFIYESMPTKLFLQVVLHKIRRVCGYTILNIDSITVGVESMKGWNQILLQMFPEVFSVHLRFGWVDEKRFGNSIPRQKTWHHRMWYFFKTGPFLDKQNRPIN